jgi:DNA topoisomerase-3
LKEVTTVFGESAKVPFKASGVRITQPGWTSLYPRKENSQSNQKAESDGEEASGSDETQSLPQFVKGETGPHEPLIREGKTKPPPHFTENTLLGAMETAGKLVDDDALKEALKERGLGTPATRASIIETLLKRKYIARQKKNLLATDHGRYLVAVIEDANLKSAELTGDWEAKLRQIEAGRLRAGDFMREIAAYTASIVHREPPPIDPARWGNCPRCGQEIIEGKRGYGCSGWKAGCPFVLWREFRGQELSPDQIRTLLQRGAILEPVAINHVPMLLTLTKTGAVAEVLIPTSDNRGKTSAGKGKRTWRKTGEAAVEGAPEKVLGKCPLCAKDVMEQPKSYGCSGWREGCKFTIWKSIAGKRITLTIAKTLLKKGETARLKGFKSKAGKPFEAKLKIEEGEVWFVFED